MPTSYDPDLFAGAADFYDRYRPKYPLALFDFLVARFALDGSARVLDLGCGTLNASLPLASTTGEIVAMDPDPDMLRMARVLAKKQQATNVTFIHGGSRDLTAALGQFRLVVMGQAFHWMDRDQVLRDLHALVENNGGIALIGPAHGVVFEGSGPPRPRQDWETVIEDVQERYVGKQPRNPLSNPQEPRHEPALLRSRFRIAEYHEFETEHPFTADDAIGRLYSLSGNLRGRLGDGREQFETNLRAALLRLNPEGRFVDRSRAAVLVAVK